MTQENVRNEVYPYRLPVFELENQNAASVRLNSIEIDNYRNNVTFNNNALRFLRKKENLNNVSNNDAITTDLNKLSPKIINNTTSDNESNDEVKSVTNIYSTKYLNNIVDVNDINETFETKELTSGEAYEIKNYVGTSIPINPVSTDNKLYSISGNIISKRLDNATNILADDIRNVNYNENAETNVLSSYYLQNCNSNINYATPSYNAINVVKSTTTTYKYNEIGEGIVIDAGSFDFSDSKIKGVKKQIGDGVIEEEGELLIDTINSNIICEANCEKTSGNVTYNNSNNYIYTSSLTLNSPSTLPVNANKTYYFNNNIRLSLDTVSNKYYFEKAGIKFNVFDITEGETTSETISEKINFEDGSNIPVNETRSEFDGYTTVYSTKKLNYYVADGTRANISVIPKHSDVIEGSVFMPEPSKFNMETISLGYIELTNTQLQVCKDTILKRISQFEGDSELTVQTLINGSDVEAITSGRFILDSVLLDKNSSLFIPKGTTFGPATTDGTIYVTTSTDPTNSNGTTITEKTTTVEDCYIIGTYSNAVKTYGAINILPEHGSLILNTTEVSTFKLVYDSAFSTSINFPIKTVDEFSNVSDKDGLYFNNLIVGNDQSLTLKSSIIAATDIPINSNNSSVILDGVNLEFPCLIGQTITLASIRIDNNSGSDFTISTETIPAGSMDTIYNITLSADTVLYQPGVFLYNQITSMTSVFYNDGNERLILTTTDTTGTTLKSAYANNYYSDVCAYYKKYLKPNYTSEVIHPSVSDYVDITPVDNNSYKLTSKTPITINDTTIKTLNYPIYDSNGSIITTQTQKDLIISYNSAILQDMFELSSVNILPLETSTASNINVNCIAKFKISKEYPEYANSISTIPISLAVQQQGNLYKYYEKSNNQIIEVEDTQPTPDINTVREGNTYVPNITITYTILINSLPVTSLTTTFKFDLKYEGEVLAYSPKVHDDKIYTIELSNGQITRVSNNLMLDFDNRQNATQIFNKLINGLLHIGFQSTVTLGNGINVNVAYSFNGEDSSHQLLNETINNLTFTSMTFNNIRYLVLTTNNNISTKKINLDMLQKYHSQLDNKDYYLEYTDNTFVTTTQTIKAGSTIAAGSIINNNVYDTTTQTTTDIKLNLSKFVKNSIINGTLLVTDIYPTTSELKATIIKAGSVLNNTTLTSDLIITTTTTIKTTYFEPGSIINNTTILERTYLVRDTIIEQHSVIAAGSMISGELYTVKTEVNDYINAIYYNNSILKGSVLNGSIITTDIFTFDNTNNIIYPQYLAPDSYINNELTSGPVTSDLTIDITIINPNSIINNSLITTQTILNQPFEYNQNIYNLTDTLNFNPEQTGTKNVEKTVGKSSQSTININVSQAGYSYNSEKMGGIDPSCTKLKSGKSGSASVRAMNGGYFGYSKDYTYKYFDSVNTRIIDSKATIVAIPDSYIIVEFKVNSLSTTKKVNRINVDLIFYFVYNKEPHLIAKYYSRTLETTDDSDDVVFKTPDNGYFYLKSDNYCVSFSSTDIYYEDKAYGKFYIDAFIGITCDVDKGFSSDVASLSLAWFRIKYNNNHTYNNWYLSKEIVTVPVTKPLSNYAWKFDTPTYSITDPSLNNQIYYTFENINNKTNKLTINNRSLNFNIANSSKTTFSNINDNIIISSPQNVKCNSQNLSESITDYNYISVVNKTNLLKSGTTLIGGSIINTKALSGTINYDIKITDDSTIMPGSIIKKYSIINNEVQYGQKMEAISIATNSVISNNSILAKGTQYYTGSKINGLLKESVGSLTEDTLIEDETILKNGSSIALGSKIAAGSIINSNNYEIDFYLPKYFYQTLTLAPDSVIEENTYYNVSTFSDTTLTLTSPITIHYGFIKAGSTLYESDLLNGSTITTTTTLTKDVEILSVSTFDQKNIILASSVIASGSKLNGITYSFDIILNADIIIYDSDSFLAPGSIIAVNSTVNDVILTTTTTIDIKTRLLQTVEKEVKTILIQHSYTFAQGTMFYYNGIKLNNKMYITDSNYTISNILFKTNDTTSIIANGSTYDNITLGVIPYTLKINYSDMNYLEAGSILLANSSVGEGNIMLTTNTTYDSKTKLSKYNILIAGSTIKSGSKINNNQILNDIILKNDVIIMDNTSIVLNIIDNPDNNTLISARVNYSFNDNYGMVCINSGSSDLIINNTTESTFNLTNDETKLKVLTSGFKVTDGSVLLAGTYLDLDTNSVFTLDNPFKFKQVGDLIPSNTIRKGSIIYASTQAHTKFNIDSEFDFQLNTSSNIYSMTPSILTSLKSFDSQTEIPLTNKILTKIPTTETNITTFKIIRGKLANNSMIENDSYPSGIQFGIESISGLVAAGSNINGSFYQSDTTIETTDLKSIAIIAAGSKLKLGSSEDYTIYTSTAYLANTLTLEVSNSTIKQGSIINNLTITSETTILDDILINYDSYLVPGSFVNIYLAPSSILNMKNYNEGSTTITTIIDMPKNIAYNDLKTKLKITNTRDYTDLSLTELISKSYYPNYSINVDFNIIISPQEIKLLGIKHGNSELYTITLYPEFDVYFVGQCLKGKLTNTSKLNNLTYQSKPIVLTFRLINVKDYANYNVGSSSHVITNINFDNSKTFSKTYVCFDVEDKITTQVSTTDLPTSNTNTVIYSTSTSTATDTVFEFARDEYAGLTQTTLISNTLPLSYTSEVKILTKNKLYSAATSINNTSDDQFTITLNNITSSTSIQSLCAIICDNTTNVLSFSSIIDFKNSNCYVQYEDGRIEKLTSAATSKCSIVDKSFIVFSGTTTSNITGVYNFEINHIYPKLETPERLLTLSTMIPNMISNNPIQYSMFLYRENENGVYEKYAMIMLDICNLSCCSKHFSVRNNNTSIEYSRHLMNLNSLLSYYSNGNVITDDDTNTNRFYLLGTTNSNNSWYPVTQERFISTVGGNLSGKYCIKLLNSYVSKSTKYNLDAIESELYNYNFEVLSNFNSRQFISLPNSLPLDYKTAYRNIDINNYMLSFNNALFYRKCDQCEYECCEIKGITVNNQTNSTYKPSVSLQSGYMSINKENLDKTPIYITTMLPNSSSSNLQSGVITFTNSNNDILQTNTYSVVKNKTVELDITAGNKTQHITQDLQKILVDSGNINKLVKGSMLTIGSVLNGVNIETDIVLETTLITGDTIINSNSKIMKGSFINGEEYSETITLVAGQTISISGSNYAYGTIINFNDNETNRNTEILTLYPGWMIKSGSSIASGSTINNEPINVFISSTSTDIYITNSTTLWWSNDDSTRTKLAAGSTIYVDDTFKVLTSQLVITETTVVPNTQYSQFILANSILGRGSKLNGAAEKEEDYKLPNDVYITTTTTLNPNTTILTGSIIRTLENETVKQLRSDYIIPEYSYKTGIGYPGVPDRLYFTFYIPILTSSGNFENLAKFNVHINEIIATYNSFTFTQSDMDQFLLDTPVYISQEINVDSNSSTKIKVGSKINKGSVINGYEYDSSLEVRNKVYYGSMLNSGSTIIYTHQQPDSDKSITTTLNIDSLKIFEHIIGAGSTLENCNLIVLNDDNTTSEMSISKISSSTTLKVLSGIIGAGSKLINSTIDLIGYPILKIQNYNLKLNNYLILEPGSVLSSGSIIEGNSNINLINYQTQTQLTSNLTTLDLIPVSNKSVLTMGSVLLAGSILNGNVVSNTMSIKTNTVVKYSNINDNIYYLDTIFIPPGNYKSISELVSTINQSIKSSIVNNLTSDEVKSISFKDNVKINVQTPNILLLQDAQNSIYNIEFDNDKFNLHDLTLTINKGDTLKINYITTDDVIYNEIATYNSDEPIVIDLKNSDVSTWRLDSYIPESSVFVYTNNLETPILLELSSVVSDNSINDNMFSNLIVDGKDFIQTDGITEGKRNIYKFPVEIIPVEFDVIDKPDNTIDYNQLIKDYQNFGVVIDKNANTLIKSKEVIDTTEITVPEFGKDDEQTKLITTYLNKYFKAEKFYLCFKQNVRSLWHNLGVTPMIVDKTFRPKIIGSENVDFAMNTNIFNPFNEIIWYNYLSSYFVETTYLKDTINIPHTLIYGTKKIKGDTSNFSELNLEKSTWEAESLPYLRVEKKFTIKVSVDDKIEYVLNVGDNYGIVADIDNIELDKDNNTLKLNIFKTIDMSKTDKVYVYIDSDNHYPFKDGVNAELSLEWILNNNK